MRFSRTFILGAIAIALLSGALLAQDIPLNNWTVPPYTSSASRGGITTMTDSTPPRLFVGIQPCRVTDTRGNGAPIQGGIFGNGETRTWDVTNICGIPAGADAISANFTVTGSPAAPPGAFILAWPTGGPVPPVSILNFQAGQTIANAAIVPLGASEQINVNVSHSTHILMDVNGYFSDTLQNQQNYLLLTNNSTGYTAYFDNNSTICSGACGVYAETSSGTAIWGNALDTVGTALGVYGETNTTTSNSAGVYGVSDNAAGVTFGVRGRNDSLTTGAAAVYGAIGSPAYGTVIPANDLNISAAVWGIAGAGIAVSSGVLGQGTARGVTGYQCTDANPSVCGTGGVVGYNGNAGLHSFGDITAGGTKFFVTPHPSDASKEIRYISLEGPEAGTYFRGRGRFQNGLAVINVPESFRLVTEPEGLSIQVTPIGEMATVAVQSIGLDRIVVKGSRNVEFFYTVNGVRADYGNFNPIMENTDFRPSSENDTMSDWKLPQIRKALISNGTLTPDGRVNVETAQRLGWDRIWAERARPTPQPSEPTTP